jgi:pSer/pThr/pTyr-binding forkhead associated (FHA) protein
MPDNSKIAIDNPVKVLGRGDFEKVVSRDNLKYVSRQHFVIYTEGGKYYIEDQNSANGTKINGHEIRGKGKQELKNGDKIDLADMVVLTFRINDVF